MPSIPSSVPSSYIPLLFASPKTVLPTLTYGTNPKSFGHHGWGGSFGFADPDKKLGVAFTMNYTREPVDAPDPRFMALIQAVYASV